MPNPEIFQAAANLAHQAKELADFGTRNNLVQTLTELGHPYGLLLNQASTSSSVESSNPLVNFFFPQEKGQLKYNVMNSGGNFNEGHLGMLASSTISSPVSTSAILAIGITKKSWPSLKPFSKSTSINSSLGEIGVGIIESDLKEGYDQDRKINDFKLALIPTSSSKGSILGSAKSSPDSAQKLHLQQVFAQQAFLAPLFLKALAGEKDSPERTRELEISQHAVGLGTTSIKLTTYKGEQPFVIKTPQGEAITEVIPGDPLAFMHVSHQAKFLHDLAPMEKVQQITGDFFDLLTAITQSDNLSLNDQQIQTMTKAKSATIIGISHLVRLFGRKTGLPTWKLDVLPELVQKFHQHDSQAVSRAFGGTRKVKPNDVEMMVITPQMRQQLIATI